MKYTTTTKDQFHAGCEWTVTTTWGDNGWLCEISDEFGGEVWARMPTELGAKRAAMRLARARKWAQQ